MFVLHLKKAQMSHFSHPNLSDASTAVPPQYNTCFNAFFNYVTGTIDSCDGHRRMVGWMDFFVGAWESFRQNHAVGLVRIWLKIQWPGAVNADTFYD